MMPTQQVNRPRIYNGDGDILMQHEHRELGVDRIVLVPDGLPSNQPDTSRRIRILWGQHLLEDLLAGRYRTLICAVNEEDNHRGIITQVAELLPTSQWNEQSITAHAAEFQSHGGKAKVLKYDMDMVEVLAILRPPGHSRLGIEDLATAFKIVSQMIQRKPSRIPSASVSFLGAHANLLVDSEGNEPSFETVLRTMYDAGYAGDVYPSPQMWQLGAVGLYPRYPFPPALDHMREGGY
ncbi:MAG TPA: hypothetical protein VHP11_16190 [Tepidisphaeraceae bacterium]|nr:hypothetical protein [Tepidisphaeraceae bacterium]